MSFSREFLIINSDTGLMLENISVKGNSVSFTLKLPYLNVPIKDLLISNLRGAIAKVDKDAEVNVSISEMSEGERMRFVRMARENWREE